MKIVKDWGTHFLRDDSEIRKGDPLAQDQIEGYSLFQRKPYYGRVMVYGGSLEWAIEQAEKEVKKWAR